MVHAETYRRVIRATCFEERHKRFLEAPEFGGIFFVGIFDLAESSSRIHEVARIDPDFLHLLRSRESCAWIEMDVGNKRHIAAAFSEPPADFAEIGRLAHALCRETHQLRSRIDYAPGLGDGRLGVHCGSRSHRLDADGIVSPDGSVADTHLQGGPAMITEF